MDRIIDASSNVFKCNVQYMSFIFTIFYDLYASKKTTSTKSNILKVKILVEKSQVITINHESNVSRFIRINRFLVFDDFFLAL